MYVPYRNSYRHASRDFLRMRLVILLKVAKKKSQNKNNKKGKIKMKVTQMFIKVKKKRIINSAIIIQEDILQH